MTGYTNPEATKPKGEYGKSKNTVSVCLRQAKADYNHRKNFIDR